MKDILRYIKVFSIIVVSFFVFSVLSCLIPYKSVQKNIEKSLPEILGEGDYPKVILKGYNYIQDNFTDALILNIIVSSDSKKPVWNAMMNPYDFHSPIENCGFRHLEHKINNSDSGPCTPYGRYWFGSVAISRILLLVMTYQQIKWFLYVVSTLLLLIFAVKIVNRVGWIKSLPIFLSLLFGNLFVMQFSIQFFPVLAIALVCGIWMCGKRAKTQKEITMLLFIAGMFTAYFDLLTIPLLTLGFPLVVYLILQSDEKKSLLEIFKSIFILCLFWVIGYACAWAIKWVLVAVFADFSKIKVFQAIQWRTTTGNYSRWDSIARNFNQIPIVWLNTVLTTLLLLTISFFNKKGIKWAITFVAVGLLPYIWYFVLSSHSHPHWWFTYRAQIISMACIMSAFVTLIDWEKLKLKCTIRKK